MIKNFLFFLFALVILSGCEDETPVPNVRQLLTNRSQKTWRIISLYKNDKKVSLEACNADNLWICRMDGIMQLMPGFVRCRIDEQAQTRRWMLNGTENTLYLRRITDLAGSGQERVEKHRILKLTEDTLRIEQIDEDIYGMRADKYERTFITQY